MICKCLFHIICLIDFEGKTTHRVTIWGNGQTIRSRDWENKCDNWKLWNGPTWRNSNV